MNRLENRHLVTLCIDTITPDGRKLRLNFPLDTISIRPLEGKIRELGEIRDAYTNALGQLAQAIHRDILK